MGAPSSDRSRQCHGHSTAYTEQDTQHMQEQLLRASVASSLHLTAHRTATRWLSLAALESALSGTDQVTCLPHSTSKPDPKPHQKRRGRRSILKAKCSTLVHLHTPTDTAHSHKHTTEQTQRKASHHLLWQLLVETLDSGKIAHLGLLPG